MRPRVIGLLTCAVLAVPAAAQASSMSVRTAGQAVAGQTVQVVVEAAADGARLTFPELQGELGTWGCALASGPSRRRFVLPYRPAWPGRHVLTVSAISGACGPRPRVRWRPLVIDVAPSGGHALARAADDDRPSGCRSGARVPLTRHMRAARRTLVCLLNAERAGRGLPRLRPSRSLRRVASRRAHRGRAAARAGEHRLVATGEHSAASRVLATWLAASHQRADLLGAGMRSVGVAVVPGARGPMRRPGATWVLELR